MDITLSKVVNRSVPPRPPADTAGAIVDRWGPVFAAQQPQLRWRGSAAVLRIPAAVDQSGVARYVVRMDDRVIASRRAQPGIDFWRLPLPRGVSRARTITVDVIDAADNTTTVTLGTRTRASGG